MKSKLHFLIRRCRSIRIKSVRKIKLTYILCDQILLLPLVQLIIKGLVYVEILIFKHVLSDLVY